MPCCGFGGAPPLTAAAAAAQLARFCTAMVCSALQVVLPATCTTSLLSPRALLSAPQHAQHAAECFDTTACSACSSRLTQRGFFSPSRGASFSTGGGLSSSSRVSTRFTCGSGGAS